MPEGITIEGLMVLGVIGIPALWWLLVRKSPQISAKTASKEPRKVVTATKRLQLTLSKNNWVLLEKQAEQKNMELEEYVGHVISTVLNRMSF